MEDLAAWGNLGLMGMISVGVVALLYKFGAAWIDTWRERRAPGEGTPGATPLCTTCPHRLASLDRWTLVDLLRHRFWRFMDHAQDIVIPKLRIEEAGRRALATDFLVVKFRHVANCLREFCETHDLTQMTSIDLEDGIVATLGRAIDGYEAEAIRLAKARGGLEAMAVWIEKFREIHQPVVNQATDHAVSICQSQWQGDDNIAKMAAMLDALSVIMQRTLNDAERTLGRLNGSLTGLPYAGIIIGPCPGSQSGHRGSGTEEPHV